MNFKQKILKIFLCIILFVSFVTNSFARNELQEIKKFGPNPGKLKMFVHVPEILTFIKGYFPLVVAVHGCYENANGLSDLSGWNKLADENHFIVLYPQQDFLNNPSQCFNWFQKSDYAKDQGEMASLKNMINYCFDSLRIDKSRVFAYGLSAGAAMSVAMLSNYPETFKAGAIFAGGPYGAIEKPAEALKAMSNPPDKTPEEWGNLVRNIFPGQSFNYPDLIIFHGKKDIVVDYRNSCELAKQWTNLHHCDTIPEKSENNFAGHPEIRRLEYEDANQKPVVIFYQVEKMGHALAIDPGDGPMQGGSRGTFSVDIDFHSTYFVAKDFGLLIK